MVIISKDYQYTKAEPLRLKVGDTLFNSNLLLRTKITHDLQSLLLSASSRYF